jgi:hypothetical protein
VLSIGLRSSVVIFLTGCAGTRPAPTLQEAHKMETRIVEADYDRTFDAFVETLQDLSFSVDTADPSIGLVVAHRETEVALAEISKDEAPDGKKGMPTWAKVALVATGVIVVVAVVAALSDDDDDHACHQAEDCGDQRCPRHHPRRHQHPGRHQHPYDHDTQVVVIDGDHGPSRPAIYRYQLTANLKTRDDGVTSIRISGQGTKSRGGAVEKAGPIHDPEFYAHIFSHVSESLVMPPPMEAWR